MNSKIALLAVAPMFCAASALAQTAPRLVNSGTPTPECSLHVNYDRNANLPGYLVSEDGRQDCIPFTLTNQLPPADYAGQDFYADEFTDAKIRQRWARCREDAACAAAARTGAKVFTSYEPRLTGKTDPATAIDPAAADVDLRRVRRPGYFGKPPYAEPIARAEASAYTVEFTVPRDNYEKLHLNKQDPIKLRGWYLKAAGIADGQGGRRRALVVMNNGGGSELTAIDNPASQGVVVDPATGKYVPGKFPDALSEQPGMRHWRGFLAALNGAGFDVLITDRRGNGISGGDDGFNTAEQANDIFREFDQLRTGEGLRMLTPAGDVLSGAAAAGVLPGDMGIADIPVVIGGYSRGSYATAWAMQKNFVEDCNYDLPNGGCRPPLGHANIKGAILYGPNSGGLGYRLAGHDMIEAVLRTEANTTYYPDSGVFAHISAWPAVMIVRGTWDYVEGHEGSLEAYRRAREPKEIFLFRGPHPLQTQNPENMRQVGVRMVAFATAAVLGRPTVEGARAPRDLKDLVTSSADFWELTTAPKKE